MERLIYEVPDDIGVMTRLIESVPTELFWMSGSLAATKGKLKELRPFLHVESSHYRPLGEVKPPYPSIISFTQEGFQDKEGCKFGKSLAIKLLEKWYRGRVLFFRDYRDGFLYCSGARCTIDFKPTGGGRTSRIGLLWDDRFDGTAGDVEAVAAVCRELKFRLCSSD